MNRLTLGKVGWWTAIMAARLAQVFVTVQLLWWLSPAAEQLPNPTTAALFAQLLVCSVLANKARDRALGHDATAWQHALDQAAMAGCVVATQVLLTPAAATSLVVPLWGLYAAGWCMVRFLERRKGARTWPARVGASVWLAAAAGGFTLGHHLPSPAQSVLIGAMLAGAFHLTRFLPGHARRPVGKAARP